ncbi:MAG: hypothetical protein RL582_972 [Bacteroidota bacterium]
MKVSNEFKIGILGVIAIALLVLGFNFLKGNKLFTKSMTLYARYDNVQGLTPSNPVIINGLQVGTVKSISNDRSMKELIVTFSIHKDINIPANSFAHISPNPLTITKVEIILGDSSVMLKNNDSINASPSDGFLEGIINSKVDPVLLSVNKAIATIDSVLNSVNSVFDQQNKRNIASTIQHLERISASVQTSTASLEVLVDKDNGSLAKTLNNAKTFTDNLVKNNGKLNSTIDNLNLTSKNLSELDLKSTLFKLDSSISGLKTTIGKINSKEGSLGLLLNDPTLYRNLSSTSNKINTLIDDLRLHPKRYVSFSVFGKSDKKESPLSTPLPDTLNSPYPNKKANP